jgi:hypothetical protein
MPAGQWTSEEGAYEPLSEKPATAGKPDSFEAVLRNGSFTKAATELCVTQSAVSKQIRALEDWLKLPLFERLVRGIQPTPAGLALQREVGPMLQSCCVAWCGCRPSITATRSP